MVTVAAQLQRANMHSPNVYFSDTARPAGSVHRQRAPLPQADLTANITSPRLCTNCSLLQIVKSGMNPRRAPMPAALD
jgi:hypothetical protein